MTRQEFLDQVLLPLGRLTGDEQADVRRELEEHIEDRMETLLEMGWAPELAEARSLEAMGDPVEIGREMAKQYRGRGWVWIGRAAVILTVVLCIQAVLALGMLGFVWDSLSARVTSKAWTNLDEVKAAMPLDIRIPVGNDILRVVQVSTGRRGDDGAYRAELSIYTYDRIIGGVVSEGLLNHTVIENQRGEAPWGGGGGSGGGHYMREYGTKYTEIRPGDTYVTLTYRRFGEDVRVQIPLPEVAS